MPRFSSLLAFAVVCAACNKTTDTVVAAEVLPPPGADAGHAASSAPSTANAHSGPVWSLPPIKSGEALSPARFRIAIDDRSLLLDGQSIVPLPADPTQGFDAEYKRNGKNDLYVTPLADAIQRARTKSGDKGSGARLELGAKVTYRVLTEVLFTLGQSEVTTFAIVAPSAGGTVPAGELAEIRTVPPKAHGALPSSTSLNALVLVTKDGIGVKARGGNIAPGCTDVGSGLTLPNQSAGYRLGDLAQCLTRLKNISAEYSSEKTVTFTASPATTLPDVLTVLDAARGENRDLFPDVLFGIAR